MCRECILLSPSAPCHSNSAKCQTTEKGQADIDDEAEWESGEGWVGVGVGDRMGDSARLCFTEVRDILLFS